MIKIDWDTFDKAVSNGMINDFPGVDVSLRKTEYVRRFLPFFVEQRVWPEQRCDIKECLSSIGMESYDAFEQMCRTHGICGDNQFYVSRKPDGYLDLDDLESIKWETSPRDYWCDGWLRKDSNNSK